MLLHFIKVIHSKQKKNNNNQWLDTFKVSFYLFIFFLIKLGNALIVRATRVCKYTEIRFFSFFLFHTHNTVVVLSIRVLQRPRQGLQHNESTAERRHNRSSTTTKHYHLTMMITLLFHRPRIPFPRRWRNLGDEIIRKLIRPSCLLLLRRIGTPLWARNSDFCNILYPD